MLGDKGTTVRRDMSCSKYFLLWGSLFKVTITWMLRVCYLSTLWVGRDRKGIAPLICSLTDTLLFLPLVSSTWFWTSSLKIWLTETSPYSKYWRSLLRIFRALSKWCNRRSFYLCRSMYLTIFFGHLTGFFSISESCYREQPWIGRGWAGFACSKSPLISAK